MVNDKKGVLPALAIIIIVAVIAIIVLGIAGTFKPFSTSLILLFGVFVLGAIAYNFSKRENADPRTVFAFLIGGILLFLLFYYHPFSQSIVGTSCNLGSWDIGSVDLNNGKMVINAGVGNIASEGCIGTYKLANVGTNAVTNKEDCEAIGFSWYDNSCRIAEGWFKNYQYTSNIVCTTSCIDPRGCGGVGLGYGQTRTSVYTPAFDGYTIHYDAPYNSWTPYSCTGTLTVNIPSRQIISPTPITPTPSQGTTPTATPTGTPTSNEVPQTTPNYSFIPIIVVIALAIILVFVIYKRFFGRRRRR